MASKGAKLFERVKDLVGEGSLYMLTRELMKRGYDKEPPPPSPPLTSAQKAYIREALERKGGRLTPNSRKSFEWVVKGLVGKQFYGEGSWPNGVVKDVWEHPHDGDLVVILNSTFCAQGWEWFQAGMPEEE